MNDLTIVIKTFIRYGILKRCIAGFQHIAPGVQIIVIDDSPDPQPIEIEGVRQIITKPDIGVSAGRNIGFKEASTANILYSDDDHLARMSPEDFAEAYSIFTRNDIDLLGWRGYRFNRIAKTLHVIGQKCQPESKWQTVDATLNLFFAKRSVLLEVPHDERVKIGGEHFDFFLALGAMGCRIASTPLLNFKNARTGGPVYRKYRNRSGHQITKKKHGINKVVWS